MVDFEDGSSFAMTPRFVTAAPCDANHKAANKRKVASQDAAADETSERRASKQPRTARKRKTAANDATGTSSSATQATQATPQAAASKKRKAAPTGVAKVKPAAKKKARTAAPSPAASQVAQPWQAHLHQETVLTLTTV